MLEDELMSGIRGCLNIGKLENVEDLMRQLSGLKPEDYAVKTGRAQNLVSLGKLEEAERLYDEVISKSGRQDLEIIARVELLMLYKRKGDMSYVKEDFDNAYENYRKALEQYEKVKEKNAPVKCSFMAMVAIGNISLALEEYEKAELIFCRVKDDTGKLLDELIRSKTPDLDLIYFLSESERICASGIIGAREHYYNPPV